MKRGHTAPSPSGGADGLTSSHTTMPEPIDLRKAGNALKDLLLEGEAEADEDEIPSVKFYAILFNQTHTIRADLEDGDLTFWFHPQAIGQSSKMERDDAFFSTTVDTTDDEEDVTFAFLKAVADLLTSQEGQIYALETGEWVVE